MSISMRAIYQKIAQEHGITVEEVKQEMQATINDAYMNTPNDGITDAYQNCVPRKKEIPTTEEFIRYVAAEVKKHKQDK